MTLHVGLASNSYDIILERGALALAGKHLRLDRKVLVVTDSGVPAEYAEKVASACKEAHIVTIPEGEASKSLAMFETLLREMLTHDFTRTDCVLAVGGGVVGDLSGFAASSYMRGIDFYNIPTTLLSQVDSSVGGKVAVDLDGVKNIVGAFYQPKKVIIDPELLSTLPERQLCAGLAESLKMGLTSDAKLYALFRDGRAKDELDEVIRRSLEVKIAVVEKDEKENGLRRVLNFGHTLGHGIESHEGLSGLLHGECVALGMIPMCSDKLRPELVKTLELTGLPTKISADIDEITALASHDKKCDGDSISVVYVDVPGTFRMEKMRLADWKAQMKERFAPYCV